MVTATASAQRHPAGARHIQSLELMALALRLGFGSADSTIIIIVEGLGTDYTPITMTAVFSQPILTATFSTPILTAVFDQPELDAVFDQPETDAVYAPTIEYGGTYGQG